MEKILNVTFNVRNETLPVTLGESFNQTVVTTDHNSLNNRDLAEQHPIKAITGLEDTLKNFENRISELEHGGNSVEVQTRSELPNRGEKSTLYVVASENATYRWDEENSRYFCIGRDYEELEIIICGGNA